MLTAAMRQLNHWPARITPSPWASLGLYRARHEPWHAARTESCHPTAMPWYKLPAKPQMLAACVRTQTRRTCGCHARGHHTHAQLQRGRVCARARLQGTCSPHMGCNTRRHICCRPCKELPEQKAAGMLHNTYKKKSMTGMHTSCSMCGRNHMREGAMACARSRAINTFHFPPTGTAGAQQHLSRLCLHQALVQRVLIITSAASSSPKHRSTKLLACTR